MMTSIYEERRERLVKLLARAPAFERRASIFWAETS